MKHTANITGNQSVFLCEVQKGELLDMYEATIFATGTFSAGTVTIQASPDGGTTKVNLRDITGEVVAITQDDVYNVRLGNGRKLGDYIQLYATMAGAGTPAVAISVFDNR